MDLIKGSESSVSALLKSKVKLRTSCLPKTSREEHQDGVGLHRAWSREDSTAPFSYAVLVRVKVRRYTQAHVQVTPARRTFATASVHDW